MTVRLDIQSNLTSAISELQKLKSVLEQTGQAGKKLKDIQLNDKQLGEAADLFDRVRDNLYAMRKQGDSYTIMQRAKALGYDPDKPLDWVDKIDSFYQDRERSRKAADRFRGKLYYGAGYEPPPPSEEPPQGPEQAAGGAGGGGLVRRTGRWVWNKSIGVLGAAAGIAGVGGALGMLVEGYREHKTLLEGTEGFYKRLTGGADFGSLTENVRDLGKALQLTSGEATRLAESFQEASGATDQQAFERIEGAGRFGRGFGIDPTQAAATFGRAELVGYGNTKQSQREFATLLAQTIGSSGMFGRSEQVMEDMVRHLGTVADREGRTASQGEMNQFGALLSGIYSNPALRGGGAGNVMQSLNNLGGGEGNLMQDYFAWMAYGGVAKGDFIRLQKFRDASPFATEKDIFGEGDDTKTKLELSWAEIQRQARFLPGNASEKDKQAYMLHELLGINTNMASTLAGILPGMEGREGGAQAFFKYVQDASGGNIEKLNSDALSNLAKLFNGQTSVTDMAQRYVADNAKTSPEDKATIKQLIDSGDEEGLRRELPKIIARTGEEGNEARDLQKTMADLSRAIEKELGSGIVDMSKNLAKLAAESLPAMGKLLTGAADATTALTKFLTETAIPAFKEAWDKGSNTMRELTDQLKLISDWLGIGKKDERAEDVQKEIKPEADKYPEIKDDTKGMEWATSPKVIKNRAKAYDRLELPQDSDRGILDDSRGMEMFLDPDILAKRKQAAEGKTAGKRKTRAEQNEMFNRHIDFLMDRLMSVFGLSEAQAAGGVGNLAHESEGLVPGIQQRNTKKGKGGLGWAQWTGPRRRQFEKWAADHRMSTDDPAANWGFLEEELKGDYADTIKALKGAKSPEEATRIWHDTFEKSADVDKNGKIVKDQYYNRERWAKMALDARSKKTPGPVRPDTKMPSDEWIDDMLKRSLMVPAFDVPKTPPEMDRVVSSMSTPDPVNARWMGQVAMEVVFKDSRGNVVQKRQGLAVSEPRIPGSGGLNPNTSRFTWNDSVTIPAA